MMLSESIVEVERVRLLNRTESKKSKKSKKGTDLFFNCHLVAKWVS